MAALSSGTRLGTYEILEPIGAGGMGEVYKARDTKLDRDVAIKVLPDAVAGDQERLARLEREAKLLASVNHPAIATLHGLEDIDGTRLIVMELVEGEDLSERLERGPLSLRTARHLFGQIAEGLDAAHEKGVIHRDLKPANIMITERDGVKILDFGLAKAFEAASSDSEISQSPTLSRGTAAGVIMGTASYMSPEQARGKSVDKRTDIWAFGCCLYEALTGRKAFDADNATDILAAIVHHEPDWQALPTATPASTRALLRKCLTKDRMERLRDIGDASFDEDAPPSDGAPGSRAWPWAIAAAGVLAGFVGVLSNGARPEADARVRRFTVTLPEPASVDFQQMVRLALSRDGRQLAFIGGRDTNKRLYLRNLDSFDATPVPGTEDALNPIFSPDGRWVAFAANVMLKKVSTEGGPPIDVTPISPVSRGASWGVDDHVVVSPTYSSGLIRASAGGGEPELLLALDRSKNEAAHLWPQVLDEDRIVFTVWSGGSFDEATIALLSRATGQYRTLIEGGSYGRVTRSGHLVFARGDSLFAVAFNRERGEVDGSPVPVLNDVLTGGGTGVAQFDVSDDGTLAYIPAGPEDESFLTWADREGTVERIPVEPRSFFGPRLSPDGSRLVMSVLTDIWIYDLNRDAFQRLTFSAINVVPVWSGDGSEVIYASTIAGQPTLYAIPAAGGREARALTDEGLVALPGSESVLGDLAYRVAEGPGHDFDIWTLRRDEAGSAQPFVETPFNEDYPEFSPDGRFMAYVSDETGRSEVFVRTFPDSGAKWSVSSGEGTEPAWAPDGKSLYYRTPTEMMIVDVTTDPAFSVSRPRALFEDRFERWPASPGLRNFDLSPDGERFLVLESTGRDEYNTIHVVLDWFEELEQLVPTR